MSSLASRFILDDQGNKVEVVLSMEMYEQLLGDLRDLATIVDRYDEALVSMAEVLQRLEQRGIISPPSSEASK